MKKLAIVACLYAEYICGMSGFNSANSYLGVPSCQNNRSVVLHNEGSNDQIKVTNNDTQMDISSTTGESSQRKDKSIQLSDAMSLISQISNNNDVHQGAAENNAFETLESAYREGRFWTYLKKVSNPLVIIANGATMVTIPLAKSLEGSNPAASEVLTYVALGSAITSGVLSLCITKMNSRINTLNIIYKARLEEQKVTVNAGNV